MDSNPSKLVRRITGTFIPDEALPSSPTHRWLTELCRTGPFQRLILEFAVAQEEELDSAKVCVDAVTPTGIRVRIPGHFVDSESPSPSFVSVEAVLDPTRGTITRVL